MRQKQTITPDAFDYPACYNAEPVTGVKQEESHEEKSSEKKADASCVEGDIQKTD